MNSTPHLAKTVSSNHFNVLIIGQGGREHAFVKALKHSPSVAVIHAIPGNPGMSTEAIRHDISWQDSDKMLQFCKEHQIHYVIIGPEGPLVHGLSDTLRAQGIKVVGPSKVGAELEGSKVFAKNFMKEGQVATSPFHIVNNVNQTLEIAEQFYNPPFVLKADGLAAGKGVSICKTLPELREAAVLLFEKKIFGAAGESAVLEKFIPGYELSLIILTNGTDYQILPIAEDHKQLNDFDQGPNTGGMGTVAPKEVDPFLMSQIKERIIHPTLKQIQEKQILFRGMIFFGIMVTKDGPECLEYNTRFGDPEAQVILPLLEGDWGQVFAKVADGEIPAMNWKAKTHTCCVILAAPGYPDQPKLGIEIQGDPLAQGSSSYFIHSGTSRTNNQWFINGGRVLGAVGFGFDVEGAIKAAYAQSEKVSWQGLQKRNDIGKRPKLS